MNAPPARRILLCSLLCLGFGVMLAPAQEEATDESKGWSVKFSPGTTVFPVYIADPRRPTFAVLRVHQRK